MPHYDLQHWIDQQTWQIQTLVYLGIVVFTLAYALLTFCVIAYFEIRYQRKQP